ncbi:hypothetical protein HZU67_05041 [Apis mellifera carnica]|nr:hypothetical protein HZU67_05041 [Apis mellifera carnica]
MIGQLSGKKQEEKGRTYILCGWQQWETSRATSFLVLSGSLPVQNRRPTYGITIFSQFDEGRRIDRSRPETGSLRPKLFSGLPIIVRSSLFPWRYERVDYDKILPEGLIITHVRQNFHNLSSRNEHILDFHLKLWKEIQDVVKRQINIYMLIKC